MLTDDDVHGALLGPIRQFFTVGGKMMNFIKVDDYTFKFEFAGPIPSFPLVNFAHVFGFSHDNALPGHYLKQFHAKYNDKAAEQAKAAGFEGWPHVVRLQDASRTRTRRCRAWAPTSSTSITPQAIIYKRNPYYWMVDADGKQLPYLDGMQLERVDDVAVDRGEDASPATTTSSRPALQVKNFKSVQGRRGEGRLQDAHLEERQGRRAALQLQHEHRGRALAEGVPGRPFPPGDVGGDQPRTRSTR